MPKNQGEPSPPPNIRNDAMGKALQQISCSPFSEDIEKPFDSLITMSMKKGEILRVYFALYGELYNEIKGNNRGVASNCRHLIFYPLRLKPLFPCEYLV